ncbi:hypothetical protein Syun_017116 [Stephania yunnanensis]|uniref:Large ribosomal subunit protein bL12 C-terminal domain-containing protein n=1 Tax=Stephania yunnanensis TaxID=152371 RepID=A0AAP0P321_9MAGN
MRLYMYIYQNTLTKITHPPPISHIPHLLHRECLLPLLLELAPHLLRCFITTKSLHIPLSTTTETQSQKLDRIATELLDLTKLDRGARHESKGAEKTSFDLKLEKFDAAAKIKIIKEVRSFTDLGLKEAKELVEKRTNRTKRTNIKPCLVEMEICDLVKVLC